MHALQRLAILGTVSADVFGFDAQVVTAPAVSSSEAVGLRLNDRAAAIISGPSPTPDAIGSGPADTTTSGGLPGGNSSTAGGTLLFPVSGTIDSGFSTTDSYESNGSSFLRPGSVSSVGLVSNGGGWFGMGNNNAASPPQGSTTNQVVAYTKAVGRGSVPISPESGGGLGAFIQDFAGSLSVPAGLLGGVGTDSAPVIGEVDGSDVNTWEEYSPEIVKHKAAYVGLLDAEEILDQSETPSENVSGNGLDRHLQKQSNGSSVGTVAAAGGLMMVGAAAVGLWTRRRATRNELSRFGSPHRGGNSELPRRFLPV